eukprot:gnl/TRDRNA2_/TRDRNA2_176591_c7_seq15.p1 gnl/TRDRNA2_/TRDRNA2_176591_c7~~gnl/TRDRNA2_/TRDRNA2_176591_c7_seq15.p1  ORF type:complete len:338 (+),score=53.52 gnl/TRDRNA2_/TRDRNA2_176591_c7_seq15:265-1278(+)
MLRSLPELMVMIKGMVTAAASVGYTLALLMIITYVFSIAFRNLVPPGSDIEEAYFSSVPEAMHNLIIYATFLDSLSDFILSLKESSPVCFIVAWIYISLASLTVMNMLIGVLCEVISAVAAEENESTMVDKINEKFGEIVAQLDENNDGTISWDEFQGILEYPEATLALESVNVDPEGMIDMAEDVFFEDGQEACLSFNDFMGMVLDLRGGQNATVKDIMSNGKRLNGKILGVAKRIDKTDTRLDSIEDHLQTVVNRMDSIDARLERLGAGRMETVRPLSNSNIHPPQAAPLMTDASYQPPRGKDAVRPNRWKCNKTVVRDNLHVNGAHDAHGYSPS